MTTPTTSPTEIEFRRFHERNSARVYSYVRRHCDEFECDDVIAEVFVIAWRRWSEVPDDPIPWLLATARKTLANHWRSRDRRTRLMTELASIRSLSTEDAAGAAIERVEILTGLAALTPADREILLLVGWDGLDAVGVAKVLGITPVAARARLSRARHRLAVAIDPPRSAPQPSTPSLVEGN